jgi:hypothetical protein
MRDDLADATKTDNSECKELIWIGPQQRHHQDDNLVLHVQCESSIALRTNVVSAGCIVFDWSGICAGPEASKILASDSQQGYRKN